MLYKCALPVLLFTLVLPVYHVLPGGTMPSSTVSAGEWMTETLQQNEITIRYPQLTGGQLGDDRTNRTIREKALHLLEAHDLSQPDAMLDMDYEITRLTPELLSIVYTGYYDGGTAYPTNVFYTTNIDRLTGQPLTLQDVIEVDETLVNRFRQSPPIDGQNAEWAEAIAAHLGQYTDEELVRLFRMADLTDGSNTGQVFTYYTPNALGISKGIPHVLGDYVRKEIPYDELPLKRRWAMAS